MEQHVISGLWLTLGGGQSLTSESYLHGACLAHAPPSTASSQARRRAQRICAVALMEPGCRGVHSRCASWRSANARTTHPFTGWCVQSKGHSQKTFCSQMRSRTVHSPVAPVAAQTRYWSAIVRVVAARGAHEGAAEVGGAPARKPCRRRAPNCRLKEPVQHQRAQQRAQHARQRCAAGLAACMPV